jgi:hypothetical protein
LDLAWADLYKYVRFNLHPAGRISSTLPSVLVQSTWASVSSAPLHSNDDVAELHDVKPGKPKFSFCEAKSR